MRYWGLGLLGIAVSAAAIAAAASSLYWLLLVGTCASGGPYEIARECPDGTGGRIMLLTGGIFGLMIGLAIFAARGYRGERAARIGRAAWGLGFAALAASFFYAGFGPDTQEDGTGWKLFTGGMGAMFALFALPTLLLNRATSGSDPFLSVAPKPAPAALQPQAGAPSPAAPAVEAETLADHLRHLNDLRTSGVLDDQEFEAAKTRLLGGGGPEPPT